MNLMDAYKQAFKVLAEVNMPKQSSMVPPSQSKDLS